MCTRRLRDFVAQRFEEWAVGCDSHAYYPDGGLDDRPDCYFKGEECEVFFRVAEGVDVDYADNY